MSSTYLTTFNGEVGLNSRSDSLTLTKIKTVIENKFADLITLDEQTKTLYIKGEFDNSNELVEKFLVKIKPLVDNSEDVIIKAQGQDLKDRYDIIIRPEGIYIQDYKLVKDELRRYA